MYMKGFYALIQHTIFLVKLSASDSNFFHPEHKDRLNKTIYLSNNFKKEVKFFSLIVSCWDSTVRKKLGRHFKDVLHKWLKIVTR